MDRIEAMKLLIAAVDAGSLSAAGRQAGIPLPTISRKISDLEALIGSRLLIRTTRRISLTDAGEAYVRASRSILDQIEDAERQAAGEFITPKGELVLSAPLLFGRLHVLPIVSAFLEQFAQINIRLTLADRNVNLADQGIDMAVRIGVLPDSTMIATNVGQMRTVTCGSPQLFEKYGRPESPGDLEKIPSVRFDAPMPSLSLEPARLERHGAGVPRLSVTTAEAAADAAINGIGYTRLLHYQVAQALQEGTLELVLERYESAPVPINLIHLSRLHMPLKMRRFLDFAAPLLRQRLLHLQGDQTGQETHHPM